MNALLEAFRASGADPVGHLRDDFKRSEDALMQRIEALETARMVAEERTIEQPTTLQQRYEELEAATTQLQNTIVQLQTDKQTVEDRLEWYQRQNNALRSQNQTLERAVQSQSSTNGPYGTRVRNTSTSKGDLGMTQAAPEVHIFQREQSLASSVTFCGENDSKAGDMARPPLAQISASQMNSKLGYTEVAGKRKRRKSTSGPTTSNAAPHVHFAKPQPPFRTTKRCKSDNTAQECMLSAMMAFSPEHSEDTGRDDAADENLSATFQGHVVATTTTELLEDVDAAVEMRSEQEEDDADDNILVIRRRFDDSEDVTSPASTTPTEYVKHTQELLSGIDTVMDPASSPQPSPQDTVLKTGLTTAPTANSTQHTDAEKGSDPYSQLYDRFEVRTGAMQASIPSARDEDETVEDSRHPNRRLRKKPAKSFKKEEFDENNQYLAFK